MTKDLKSISAVLGHTFQDVSLLGKALSHSSIAGEAKKNVAGKSHRLSNERMEFLGDRVLGLVIAEMVFEAFPDEAEGALARRHTALVCREALARVAETIKLGRYMTMSKGEHQGGGRANPALLSNAIEAVIAALYLDGGLKAAEGFIVKYWQPLMEEDLTPPRDPKTGLQEWAQARGLPLPSYREISREGPAHAPVFVMEVSVTGEGAEQAKGNNKRNAERQAAEKLLTRLERKDNQ